ncbi:hypothetical protein vseg_007518 [Gypsophila vaccaria]
MINLKLTTLLTLMTIICSSSNSQQTQTTIHQLLKDKGLPQGLIPKEVKSYTYNSQNALLKVYLEGPCLTKYDNRVKFDSEIRANLSFGSLLGVEGLTQEELFIWLPIKEISVNDPNSGVILFDIGMAQKQLSLSLFEDPPSCLPPHQANMNYNGRKDKGFEAQR